MINRKKIESYKHQGWLLPLVLVQQASTGGRGSTETCNALEDDSGIKL